MSDLSQVSIGIKTFLRDELLWKTVFDIGLSMPEVQMIIADDGENTDEKQIRYRQIRHFGHTVIEMLFDSGFGSKSNRIAEVVKRPYLLIGSDDFDFGQDFVREGIERMLEALECNPDLDVVSGRVNNRPYEFKLTEQDGVVTEIPLTAEDRYYHWTNAEYRGGYTPCDLTVNYSLVRTNIFAKGIHWDDDQIIGQGEHGAFFVDLKRAGLKVAYIPGVNINEQSQQSNPIYDAYRARARNSERSCFVKRGIKKYILGDGQIDFKI